MGTAILHIGMHKTGSSSIQDTLYALRHDLKEFHYLDMGRSNASGQLQYAFMNTGDCIRRIVKLGHEPKPRKIKNRKQIALDKLSLQLNQARGKTLIISAEGLLNLPRPELRILKKMIDDHFRHTIVVAYIRRPKSYIESAFQEILKFRNTKLDDSFISKPVYRIMLEKFENVFGSNSLHYWLFDIDKLRNGCVVSDFCEKIGLNIRPEQIVRTNDGLSLEAVRLLYLYRKYIGDQKTAEDHFRLIDKLALMPGEKLQFSDGMMAQCLGESSRDIKWMEQRLGKGSLIENRKTNDRQISTWADLENVQEVTLQWLSHELGHDISEQNSGMIIAQRIGELRDKLNKELSTDIAD